ncbi:endonuclease/exonuclease/phosphatase family protein [Microbacterium nymphoidis]|uniref:endonuclease/exonuclease/phosphatase family protein n=1 Tax=Microbacterium nymphoidis TaxID=2898586 RepID=UPI001E58C0C2|nr:endonuclease/exonuclease/phosphatase family protein [Microbacterium nymphoidis]MCD2499283.1 endonuclease/exonuclease/phosphatase family protein [Microbacterium nymphoidis]
MSGSTPGPGARSSRPRGAGRWLAIAGPLVVAIACLALLFPRPFGTERALGVAQVISFRAGVAIGLLALASGVATLIGVLAVRRRRIAPGGVATVIILLVAAIGNVAVLADRGWQADDVDAARSADAITVLSWNTQGGATSPAEVAGLAARTHADIVALPETDAVAAAEIARLLAQQGIRVNAQTTGEWIPTSLLVSERLGTYRHDLGAGSTPGLPSGVWVPQDGASAGSSPPIVVAHPMPPLPTRMQAWRDGLDWVAQQCRTYGADVVIAGDLNATLDHLPAMPGCPDAARSTGTAGWGSWPSTAPAWFAAPIDHVLAGRAWRAVAFEVVDSRGRGSDHRAIVAVLERA